MSVISDEIDKVRLDLLEREAKSPSVPQPEIGIEKNEGYGKWNGSYVLENRSNDGDRQLARITPTQDKFEVTIWQELPMTGGREGMPGIDQDTGVQTNYFMLKNQVSLSFEPSLKGVEKALDWFDLKMPEDLSKELAAHQAESVALKNEIQGAEAGQGQVEARPFRSWMAQWPEGEKAHRAEIDPLHLGDHVANGVFNFGRADVEKRDQIYGTLLDALTLNERDVQRLETMGLDKETAIANGYRSVPTSAEAPEVMEKLKGLDLRAIPGFYREKEGSWRLNLEEWKNSQGEIQSASQGFFVPVRNAPGMEIEGLQIVRAEAAQGEPNQVWLSSKGKENGTSFQVISFNLAERKLNYDIDNHPAAPSHHRNVEEANRSGVVLITEGAFKADAAAEQLGGKGVIGISDLRNPPIGFQTDFRQNYPNVRDAVIAMDADFRNSPEGKQTISLMGEALREMGIKSHALSWDARQGNSLEEYLSQSKENREMVSSVLNSPERSISQTQTETRRQEMAINF